MHCMLPTWRHHYLPTRASAACSSGVSSWRASHASASSSSSAPCPAGARDTAGASSAPRSAGAGLRSAAAAATASASSRGSKKRAAPASRASAVSWRCSAARTASSAATCSSVPTAANAQWRDLSKMVRESGASKRLLPRRTAACAPAIRSTARRSAQQTRHRQAATTAGAAPAPKVGPLPPAVSHTPSKATTMLTCYSHTGSRSPSGCRASTARAKLQRTTSVKHAARALPSSGRSAQSARAATGNGWRGHESAHACHAPSMDWAAGSGSEPISRHSAVTTPASPSTACAVRQEYQQARARWRSASSLT